MISQYWVGQIPSKPLSITVMDENGQAVNLNDYTNISVKIIGSNNEEVDLTGATVVTTNKALGQIGFKWPTTRSLFETYGDYVLQLSLAATGKLDFTTTHTLRVRELGRKNRGNVYNR
jgi:hypothetical protein